MNDFDQASYAGPCPNDGKTHQYEFQVFALSRTVGVTKSIPPKPSVRALAERLQRGDLRRRILAKGKLRGNYTLLKSQAECTGEDLDFQWQCRYEGSLDCRCLSTLLKPFKR